MKWRNEKLESAIEADGRTAFEIARAAGVSYVTLSAVRNGRQTARVDTSLRLANALGKKPEDLGLTSIEDVLRGGGR